MAKNKHKKISGTSKECQIYIDGMHCASCEVLIEKKLLKSMGVESADASLKDNKVTVRYEGNSLPDINSLNKEFNQLGYKFSNKKFKKKDTPTLKMQNGKLAVNPKKLKYFTKIILTVIGLLIGFYLFERMQFGKYVSVDSSSSLPAFFTLGIVAGLSSCAALIGGLLLSMVKQWNELYIDADTKTEKAQPHIMFHIGRLVSFTLLGGLLGLVGEAISLDNISFFSILTIIVSIVMLVLALQMLEIEWAQNFRFTAPKALTRFAADEDNFQGKHMPFIVGALTFLLPCGFTLIAQTVALTSGSFVQGALIMLVFALGTLPILLGISYGGLAFNAKPHLTAKFNLVAGLLIVFFAIYNINGQLNVLGFSSLSDIDRQTFKTSDNAPIEEAVEINEEGEQSLKITAKGFEYIPTSSMTITAGVPTKLIVDNQGIQGCGAFMAANGLIENFVSLDRGINEINLGNPQKGTYKLTCSMGMVRPVTINVV